jgi:hypothetical protein
MTIVYGAALSDKYGPEPRVDVYYRDDVTGKFKLNNGIPIGSTKFDGSNIILDFGGLASGLVKIS